MGYFHKSFCLRFHEILFNRRQTLLNASLCTAFHTQTSNGQEEWRWWDSALRFQARQMCSVGNGEANQFSRTLWIMQGVVVLSTMHGWGEYICCRFHYLRYPHCSFPKLALALFINSLFVTTNSLWWKEMDSIYRAGLQFFILFWVSELKEACHVVCRDQQSNQQPAYLCSTWAPASQWDQASCAAACAVTLESRITLTRADCMTTGQRFLITAFN